MADVVVTINPASQFLLRIIQMKNSSRGRCRWSIQALLAEIIIFAATEIVAGGEQMRGIQTYTKTIGLFHQRDNLRQVLQFVSQRTPLPGGNFQTGNDLRRG